MRKNRKISALLSISCAQCGTCCSDPFIELTHLDIQRLVKHTGLTSDRLVRLYAVSDLDSSDDHDWIHLSYGKRLMGLSKKRNGECIFLSDNLCSAYKARPMACRLFPIDPVFDDDEKLSDMELSAIIKDRFIKCRSTKNGDRSFSEFRSTAAKAQKEYELYYNKLEKWNKSGKKGKKRDFLDYLGLK